MSTRLFRWLTGVGHLHIEALSGIDGDRRATYIRELNSELERSDGYVEPHYDLVQRSLESVSHLSEHEDDKASRRLTAMAFMGALVAGFSAFALSPSAHNAEWFAKSGPWLLLLFYIFCSFGGLLTLFALLPIYNVQRIKRDDPLSLVFAQEIDRVDGKNWVRPFIQNQRDQLREQVARQHLAEIKLIAQVTMWKMKMHRLAGGYFCSALALFAGMAIAYAIQKMNTPPDDPRSHSVVIVFDADNTLWDTDALYRSAQLELLDAIERLVDQKAPGDRLSYLRGFDQHIAKSDRAGFRYDPVLLANRLYHELRQEKGLAPEQTLPDAVKENIYAAVRAYQQRLNDKPTLFPQVKDVLSKCATAQAKIILLSESSLQRVQHLLLAHELNGYFHQVFSSRNKGEIFAEIKTSMDPVLAKDCVFVSVGDQQAFDLVPAKAAGYRTVFIPAGFKVLKEDVGNFSPDFKFLTIAELGANLNKVTMASK